MAGCAVFASGQGSNFIAIHRHLLAHHPAHRITHLVTDKVDCGAREYALAQGIPVIDLVYKGHTKTDVEEGLIRALASDPPTLLVLAGFMRIVGPTLLNMWQGRIINIHPSLLPRHPGAHGIADSFASGDSFLGITVHFVDSGIDTGPIIIQESFERSAIDTLEHIENRIHDLEHQTYPHVVAQLLSRPSPKESVP